MRHHAFAFNVYGAMAGGATSTGTVSFISAVSGSSQDGSSQNFTSFNFNAASLTAGDAIIAVVMSDVTTSTINTVTDSQANTYVHDVSNVTIGAAVYDIFRASVGSSGTAGITVAWTTTGYFKIAAYFVVRGLAASPLDGTHADGSGASGATTLTPSIGNGICVAHGQDAAGQMWGPRPPFISLYNNTGFQSAGYDVYAATTPVTCSFTLSAGANVNFISQLYKGN